MYVCPLIYAIQTKYFYLQVELPTDKIEAIANISLNRSESVSMVAQIGKIAREKGLDCQEFECLSCKQPQGVTSKLKYVYFTSYLYNLYKFLF